MPNISYCEDNNEVHYNPLGHIGLYVRDSIAPGPSNYVVNEEGKNVVFVGSEVPPYSETVIQTCMVAVDGSHFSAEPGVANPDWGTVIVNFDGMYLNNCTFSYGGISYVCENSNISPVISDHY